MVATVGRCEPVKTVKMVENSDEKKMKMAENSDEKKDEKKEGRKVTLPRRYK
jgi:hypothetical protein